jgi:hypothetical protein
LAEIRDRAEKATPGPWVRFSVRKRIGGAQFILVGPEGLPIILVPTGVSAQSQNEAFIDANFVAHSRDSIPFLLAKVERLTSARDAAYTAGEKAMREKCAKVADAYAARMMTAYHLQVAKYRSGTVPACKADAGESIAADIRSLPLDKGGE